MFYRLPPGRAGFIPSVYAIIDVCFSQCCASWAPSDLHPHHATTVTWALLLNDAQWEHKHASCSIERSGWHWKGPLCFLCPVGWDTRISSLPLTPAFVRWLQSRGQRRFRLERASQCFGCWSVATVLLDQCVSACGLHQGHPETHYEQHLRGTPAPPFAPSGGEFSSLFCSKNQSEQSLHRMSGCPHQRNDRNRYQRSGV